MGDGGEYNLTYTLAGRYVCFLLAEKKRRQTTKRKTKINPTELFIVNAL
jgi:hypothetical protein